MGTMIGLAAMSLFDVRMLDRAHWRDFDWGVFREVMHFGTPFIVTYGLSFILSGSDRFLIEYFLGPDQVGIYSAGYAFPDRIGQICFMAVATASFPLTVRRLEQEGTEAARDQTYANGVAMLALAVPACMGLLLINRPLAATLIGENFRAGAIQVMPWIAISTIFNGIAAHYFDHAFHLAKKTRLFFFTLGPAALLNFIGNLYAIPHFGVMGAAYTTLAAYALYLILSIVIGRRVFRIKFPFKPALQIAVSTALMALILLGFNFPENLTGLIDMVVIGGAVYGLGILTFDIMGVRSLIIRKFHQRSVSHVSAHTPLEFTVLKTPEAIEIIADEWRALYEKSGGNVFGSYEWFQIWWRHLGGLENVRLHIATARSGGNLVALLPLVVRRSGLLRILEWAGYETFDYGDVLAENACDAEAIWRFAFGVGGYDVALIKDVRESALSLPVLANGMRLREQRKNYFLTLQFDSGEAWLAAQSRKLRGDMRRKREKMQAQGDVAFQLYRQGEQVPVAVLDALYAQKSAWFRERKASGAFAKAEVKPLLHELAADAARHNKLYLAWLTCGDVIVACHMGFIKDGILHLYHTTYDAGYGAFSPGNIMMIETIQWAIDARLRELDFMRGDEAFKQRFAGGTRALSAFIGGGSYFGKMLVLLRMAQKDSELPADPIKKSDS